ncbi:MAG: glycosyltransferase family 39 protein [Paludibacter sp.]|nr:glycosyltransferase family 39 protein [Paludibacter sp.]
MKYKIENINQKIVFYLLLACFLVIFLFFPNRNPLSDSLNYAGNVRWNGLLFFPHHLLYCWFNSLINNLLQQIHINVDTLSMMEFTNGIFAVFCLLIFQKILLLQKNDDKRANIWIFFAACSFGFMRFAVEAEAYIIPIFFSLVATYFFIKYLKNNKLQNIVFSSLIISLAVLFHQIALIFGIGMFVGFIFTKKLKHILLFALPTLIVLIIYSLIMVYVNDTPFSIKNLVFFVADFYTSPDANINFGLQNFVLLAIGFVRTFFQINGIVPYVFKFIPAFYIVAVSIVICLFSAIYYLKNLKFKKEEKLRNDKFSSTYAVVFVLLLIFALISEGNSEFLVALPFIIPFFIEKFIIFDKKIIIYLSISMFLWNFCFGIFPNNHFNIENNQAESTFVRENPNKIFIFKNKMGIDAQFYYNYGYDIPNQIIDLQKDNTILDSLRNSQETIYTDILTKKIPYNRASYFENNNINKLLFINKIHTFSSDMGSFSVDEVKIR